VAKRRTLWDYNEMGLYFYGREAYDLAIGEFKRALKAAFYPIAALYINLGAAYLGKKMYEEARAQILKGLALEPRNQKAHWLLAQALKATGSLTDALSEFERTVTINPDSPDGRHARQELRALSASRQVNQGPADEKA
jgi:tetratricopeptide (TPR) repeat protein